MSRIDTLIKNRDEAREKLSLRVDELDEILAERSWTPEEEAELVDLRKRTETLDRRLSEAEAEERQAVEQQEQRDRQLGPAANAVEQQVHVNGTGPLIYSEANPDNSFYRDLLISANTNDRGWDDARDRLKRHQLELDNIRKANPGSKEGRAIRKYDLEVRRLGESMQAASETRDVSTGTASMGDFAPPLYFLTEYGPYRTYGRTLIDQVKSYPLPDTGMVFNVPLITQPTEGVNQTSGAQGSSENTTVTTRDMTSTYQSGSLQTIIDNLLVSQQYLDRVGPGIGGDMIVRDDQQRQVNRTLNNYAWTTIYGTTGIGVNLYSDTAFNAYAFNQVVHKAKAAMQKTEGTVVYPTHSFYDPDLWETIEGSYDGNNRPYVVPQGVAFNPLAVGDRAEVPEGYTGFHFASLPAFSDYMEWLAWTGGGASSGYGSDHVAVIAALDIGAYWLESTPVIRVLPQPYAQQLTVLIQEYVYCALIVIYPAAFQLVYGTGTASNLLSA